MIRKLLNSKVRILPAMLAFLLLSGTAFSQMYLANNTTVKVQEGTLVYDGGNLNLDANSTLTNNGTMYIKGNLTNNNTTDNNLGAGTFEFNGTAAQTISGPNVFGTLIINNANGVSLTGSYNNTVSTGLTLASGRLDLGSSLSLLLGPSVTSVGGTLNASNMIVATGTGELRKQFATGTSDPAAFVFPVGDNTTTAEYSPVTLDFGSSTFADGNYAGVRLTDNVAGSPWVDPQISRYWDLSSTGISSFTCQADFVYVDADLQLGTGAETDIYCTKISPDPVVTYNQTVAATNTLSAPGLTSFSRFTGVTGGFAAALFAWLDGPYNTTNNNMDLGINPVIPLAQPYNTSPWNYAGTENVATMPADIVDWVLVSIRVATSGPLATSSTEKATVAALLKSDGSIVSTTGGNLSFYNIPVPSGYYVFPVIKHRNHVGVMANAGATKSAGVYQYDFRDVSSKVYPGDGTGHKMLETGAYGLYAGDANGDGNIWNNDLTSVFSPQFFQNGYLGGDFNLDSHVWNNDLTGKYSPNFFKSTTIPN